MIALIAIVAVAWLITIATIASGTGLLGGPDLIARRVTTARHSNKPGRALASGKHSLIEDFPDLGATTAPEYDLESYAGGGTDWFPPGMSGVDLGGES